MAPVAVDTARGASRSAAELMSARRTYSGVSVGGLGGGSWTRGTVNRTEKGVRFGSMVVGLVVGLVCAGGALLLVLVLVLLLVLLL